MTVTFDFDEQVVLVTGAAGVLGSAVVGAFANAGATVVGTDILPASDSDSSLEPDRPAAFLTADFTDPSEAEQVIDTVVEDHGRLDALATIAGTWMGGNPIEETDVEEFDALFDINLKTMFLAAKYALPHLQETAGTIVSVSARSSLSGGSGDGPYRASKAGVRRLTETIAEENLGTVRANAVMPSVIDTPMNREMMPDAEHETWVDPADIAATILWLSSDGARVTSGAAVPVYGEA